MCTSSIGPVHRSRVRIAAMVDSDTATAVQRR